VLEIRIAVLYMRHFMRSVCKSRG